MHLKSDNIEIIINDKADQVIEKNFESRLSKYQISLETTMKDSSFIIDHVHLFCYKCQTESDSW